MRTIVGFVGFCAHMVLTIPILALTFLRDLLDICSLADTAKDIGVTFGTLIKVYFIQIPEQTKIVWNAYMKDEFVEGSLFS